MSLAWDDNYSEIMWIVDDTRVSREILDDGVVSVCLYIGDV